MHKPETFSINNPDLLYSFVKTYPLALIVCSDFEANLVPVNLHIEKENVYLRCHLAKSNSQVKSLSSLNDTLVVFRGPQDYITPSLYETKKVHGKVVPTWNYSMVQVRGKCQIIRDRNWILSHLIDITNQMEVNQEKPWQLSDAPSEYIDKLIELIVGVEISVANIEGVLKMSQNQPKSNRKNIENHFRDLGDEVMADFILNKKLRLNS